MRTAFVITAVAVALGLPIQADAQKMMQPAPRDRKSLACEESLKRYTNDGCEKKCTSACKRRGTALLKCNDLPPSPPITCADK
jgi:hypothetical protein